MNSNNSLDDVKYIYDDDLWFFPPDKQVEIVSIWIGKMNPHNNELYYINPKVFYNFNN